MACLGGALKEKSGSRPSSEFIACEMRTMSEEDRQCLYRHSYTHGRERLTSVFWSITFKTAAPQNVTDNT